VRFGICKQFEEHTCLKFEILIVVVGDT
jgi:hypothetical protein